MKGGFEYGWYLAVESGLSGGVGYVRLSSEWAAAGDKLATAAAASESLV